MLRNLTPVQLSDQERYAIFLELNIPTKVIQGWIEEEIKTSHRPQYIEPLGDLPVGTVGQQIKYFVKLANGERWELAKVHQYRLPDGTIRGGPDPLYICLDDVVLTRTEKRNLS